MTNARRPAIQQGTRLAFSSRLNCWRVRRDPDMITMTIPPYRGIGSAPQSTQAFKAILRARGNFHLSQIDLPNLLLRGSSDSVCCRPKACHLRPCLVRDPKWLLNHHLRLPIFLAWNVAPRVKDHASSANERKIHEVF